MDQELAGTSTRAFWTDPTDGSLYVFVVMTKDTMDRAMANAAQAQIKKEIAEGETMRTERARKAQLFAPERFDCWILAYIARFQGSGRLPLQIGVEEGPFV